MGNLALSPEALDALFPTMLTVDETGRIIRVGRVLRRLLPELEPGARLADHFRGRPRVDLDSPGTWREGAPMLLESTLRPTVVLRGQTHRLGEELVFFNGPVVRDLAGLEALDLHLDDLAPHDASLEHLLAVQQERSSLESARALERSLQAALATEARERARLATVVSSLTSGLLMENPSRRVSLANQALCDLFGIPVPPEQLEGGDCAAALAAVAPLFADPTGFVARIEEILARSETVVGDELRLADGRIFERDYVPLAFDAGTGHLWWYRDVSEDRAIRRELAEARERAEIQDRRKTSFLAQTSHDLRTPLHVVVGVAELLAQEAFPADLRRHVRSLRGNAELVLSLVGEALDVASIEADRFRADIGSTDVRALADGLLDAFWSRADAKGLALTFDVLPTVPRLVAIDEARTRQIVANLVGNALKFTSAGSVAITFAHHDDRLTITVDDSGPGVPAEFRERLFEAFTQADGSHERFGGTGLGLSIVRDLTRRLEGNVQLDDCPLGGARFVVVLPALAVSDGWPASSLRVWIEPSVERSVRHALESLHVTLVEARERADVTLVSPEGSTGAASEIVLGRDLDRPVRFADLRRRLFGGDVRSQPERGRLLVVEDDAHASVLLVKRLEHAGWSVALERSGRAALGRLDHEPFDAVISDLHMPGGDGLELARRWRARERGHRLPMIAVTAHAVAGVRERCLDAGFDAYFTKPIDFARLDETLQNATSRGPRVLVVDDDFASLEVTARLVRGLGPVRLRGVASGEAARRSLETYGPVDVALVDVGLEGEDGREVGAWLRARGIPVVWVTGNTSARLEGEVVLKPVRRARLMAALESTLGVAFPRESTLSESTLSESTLSESTLSESTLSESTLSESTLSESTPLDHGPDLEIEIDELVADLLPEFLARAKERVRAALEALGRGDLVVARRLGHDLKGTGASYGVPTLGALGADVELAAKRESPDATHAALEALRSALEDVRWRTK